ncbi:hypothetical protein JOD55_000851 [Arcanobacterium pluranimalium]|nr:nucleotidyl transferase AbiEii/AbiGii toxin family protein [Arcanobacterium pluranimalium]MBM7825024.1 hypothetical protein [Arcanobacterium pluranimalium]
MSKKPNSMRHLDDAIRRIVGGSPQDFVRVRTAIANVIVASMLPAGVIKGGSALKLRYGDATTRFTTDLDTATSMDVSVYIQHLSEAFREGWEGFGGRVIPKEPASPAGIPEDYIM